MATHPSILTWKIPWTEEPGELLSMGFQSDATERACMNTLTRTLREANKQGYRIYQAFHIWKGLYCKNADLLEFHIKQHFKKKQQTNICGHLDLGEFFTVPSFL